MRSIPAFEEWPEATSLSRIWIHPLQDGPINPSSQSDYPFQFHILFLSYPCHILSILRNICHQDLGKEGDGVCFSRAALLLYLVGGSLCASTLTLTSASVASNWQDDIDPNNVTKARFSSWCLCVYTCLAICTSDIQFQGDTVTLVSITQCQEHH